MGVREDEARDGFANGAAAAARQSAQQRFVALDLMLVAPDLGA
jgi:hypothetical protein